MCAPMCMCTGANNFWKDREQKSPLGSRAGQGRGVAFILHLSVRVFTMSITFIIRKATTKIFFKKVISRAHRLGALKSSLLACSVTSKLQRWKRFAAVKFLTVYKTYATSRYSCNTVMGVQTRHSCSSYRSHFTSTEMEVLEAR